MSGYSNPGISPTAPLKAAGVDHSDRLAVLTAVTATLPLDAAITLGSPLVAVDHTDDDPFPRIVGGDRSIEQ